MHNTVINPEIRERYLKLKGGREFAFTNIDLAKTAHLIIDMQNGFLQKDELLEVPIARSVIPNINIISNALREKSGLNIFLRFTTTTASAWSVYFEEFQGSEFSKAEVLSFKKGTVAHALFEKLDVQDEDIILDKTRFSAFTQGSSDTLDILKQNGINTIIISGTLTDCCCEATARDAQQLGFKVIFISDACAALSDYEHNAAINSLAAWYADIRTTQELIELFEQCTNLG